jgi:hypothetical protein
MTSRVRRAALGGSLVVTLLIGACGGDSPLSPTPVPTPLPYVGNWFGTTSQGKALSFAIDGSGMTSLSFQYVLTGPACRVDGSLTLTYTPALSITGNAIASRASSSSLDLVFAGTFASAISASGQFTVTRPVSPCTGATATVTWSATRSL